jgi:hypothetical protein
MTADAWAGLILLVVIVLAVALPLVAWLRERRLPLELLATVPPELPHDVRVVLPDGTEIPADVAYVGWVDGCHRWVAVVGPDVAPVDVRVGLTPPLSMVTLP